EVERRPTGARTLLQVPDPECAEDSLKRVALEPITEQLRDRHRENAREVDDRLLAEATDIEPETTDAHQLPRIPRLNVRRGGEVQALENSRQRVHASAEVRPLCRIGGTDAA